VLITEKLALKYFGKSEVAGEMLQFDFYESPMEIVGVMKDLPRNTHLKFDLLISHSTLPIVETWYGENLWNANNDYT
jgi:putative ABC transport system permease protein